MLGHEATLGPEIQASATTFQLLLPKVWSTPCGCTQIFAFYKESEMSESVKLNNQISNHQFFRQGNYQENLPRKITKKIINQVNLK